MPWRPILLAGLLLVAGLSGPGQPALAATRSRPEPSPVDWVRAGLLVGVDFENGPTASLGGGCLGLFGLAWEHVYLLPVNVQATASGNGIVALAADAEVGWAGEWKHDQVRVGVGAGYGAWGLGRADVFVQGAALRPTVRYRRYWDDVGVEVFAAVPMVVGPGGVGRDGASRGVVLRGWSPVLGVTVGM